MSIRDEIDSNKVAKRAIVAYESLSPDDIEGRTKALNDLMNVANSLSDFDSQIKRAEDSGKDAKFVNKLWQQKQTFDDAAVMLQSYVQEELQTLEQQKAGSVLATSPEEQKITSTDLPTGASQSVDIHKYRKDHDPYHVIDLWRDPTRPGQDHNKWAQMMASKPSKTGKDFAISRRTTRVMGPAGREISKPVGDPTLDDQLAPLEREHNFNRLKTGPVSRPQGGSPFMAPPEPKLPFKPDIAAVKQQMEKYFSSKGDLRYADVPGGIINTGPMAGRSLKEIRASNGMANEADAKEVYWSQFNPWKYLTSITKTLKMAHDKRAATAAADGKPGKPLTPDALDRLAWDSLNRRIGELQSAIDQRITSEASRLKKAREKGNKGSANQVTNLLPVVAGGQWEEREQLASALRAAVENYVHSSSQYGKPGGEGTGANPRVQQVYNEIIANPDKFVRQYNEIAKQKHENEQRNIDEFNIKQGYGAGPEGEAKYKKALADVHARRDAWVPEAGEKPPEIPPFRADAKTPHFIMPDNEKPPVGERPKLPTRPEPATPEAMQQFKLALDAYKNNPYIQWERKQKDTKQQIKDEITKVAPQLARDIAGGNERGALSKQRERLNTLFKRMGVGLEEGGHPLQDPIDPGQLKQLMNKALKAYDEQTEASVDPTKAKDILHKIAEKIRSGELTPAAGLQACLSDNRDGSPGTIKHIIKHFEGLNNEFQEKKKKVLNKRRNIGEADVEFERLSLDIQANPNKYLNDWKRFVADRQNTSEPYTPDISTVTGAHTLADAIISKQRHEALKKPGIREKIEQTAKQIYASERGLDPRTGAPINYGTYNPEDPADIDALVRHLLKDKNEDGPNAKINLRQEIAENPEKFKNIDKGGPSPYDTYGHILTDMNTMDLTSPGAAEKLAKSIILKTRGEETLQPEIVDKFTREILANPEDPRFIEEKKNYLATHPMLDLATMNGAKRLAEWVVLNEINKQLVSPNAADIMAKKIQDDPDLYKKALSNFEFRTADTSVQTADGNMVGGILVPEQDMIGGWKERWADSNAADSLASWIIGRKAEKPADHIEKQRLRQVRHASMVGNIQRAAKIIKKAAAATQQTKDVIRGAEANRDSRGLVAARDELERIEQEERTQVARLLDKIGFHIYNLVLNQKKLGTISNPNERNRSAGPGLGHGAPGASWGPSAPDDEELNIRKRNSKGGWLDNFKPNTLGDSTMYPENLKLLEAVGRKVQIHALQDEESFLNGLTGTIVQQTGDDFVVNLDKNIVVEDKQIKLSKGEFLIEMYAEMSDAGMMDSAQVDFAPEEEDEESHHHNEMSHEEPEEDLFVSVDSDDPTEADLPMNGGRSSSEYPSPGNQGETGPVPTDGHFDQQDDNMVNLADVMKGAFKDGIGDLGGNGGGSECQECQSSPCECCQKCNKMPCSGCCKQCGESTANCKCDEEMRGLIDVMAQSLDPF